MCTLQQTDNCMPYTQDDEAQPDFVPTGKGPRKRKGTLTAEDFSDDDGSDGGPVGGKAVRFARSTAGASRPRSCSRGDRTWDPAWLVLHLASVPA